MLKIEKFVTPSPEQWEIIIEGMRNPKNSWDRMDSGFINDGHYQLFNGDSGPCHLEADGVYIGPNDYTLMETLAKGGPVHAKYRRMIPIYITLTAPLYWWKEFDTYKVGTVANSCSTMHKIHSKEFGQEDFSCEHMMNAHTDSFPMYDIISDGVTSPLGILSYTIQALNKAREKYLETKDKVYWWQLIQLLPSSYNQKRTVMVNYEVLHNIYISRRNHKLDEWHVFCDWIEELPYSELIIGE